ncbi:MAG: NfeD family protein [Deinococcales bacterium]
MENIVDNILLDSLVPTIAVVKNAISAGALIAISAEKVVMLPGAAIGAALPVTLDPLSPNGMQATDEKINSVVRNKFISVANARGRNALVAEAMVNPKVEIPGLVTDKELVTLSSADAVNYDIADLEAASLTEALDKLGYGNVSIVDKSPSATERAALWLTSPFVAMALLAIGIVGILLEVFIPGFGLPGILGTLALLLFFSSRFIASPTGLWDVALILIALILIVTELFIIPGFGIVGILGLALLGYSTWRMFEGNALAALSYTAIVGGGMLLLVLWLFNSGRIPKFLVLSDSIQGRSDAVGKLTDYGELNSQDLLGERGVALTDLRPTGMARFHDKRVDVVSEGDFISSGTTLEIVAVEGYRVVVRALEA